MQGNIIHVTFGNPRQPFRITTATRRNDNASRVQQVLQRATELSKLRKGDTFSTEHGRVHVMAERMTPAGRELLLASKGEQQWAPSDAIFAALPEHFA